MIGHTENIQAYDDIAVVARLLDNVRKLRIAHGNHVSDRVRKNIDIPLSREALTRIEKFESDIRDLLRGEVKRIPIWREYLKDVKGVGECLAGELVGYIGDISRFPTVSKLWAYAGLTTEYVVAECENKNGPHKLIMSSDNVNKICPVFVPSKDRDSLTMVKCSSPVNVIEKVKGQAPRRKRGYVYLFNSKLKVVVWKIASQFQKARTEPYRTIYIDEKERQLKKGLSKIHAHNRGIRKIMKAFLKDLWINWRKIEGLEVTIPYEQRSAG